MGSNNISQANIFMPYCLPLYAGDLVKMLWREHVTEEM